MANRTGELTLTTPTEREIVLTRVFGAPRGRVFDALTRPELLTRWHGPRGWSLVVCQVDLKPRGAYRFVWRRRANGAAMGMGGVWWQDPMEDGVAESYDKLAELLR